MRIYSKVLNIAIVFGFVFGNMGGPNRAAAFAGGQGLAPGKTPSPQREYFSVSTRTTADGAKLDAYIINGPPHPPAGYELERAAVALPEANQSMAANALVVPAYDWVFGCSAVSGAMIAGYYDRSGYQNIYTGPTDGGIIPLTSSAWPNWTDAISDNYPNNPLVASHLGVDNRATRGSIDDYWISYDSTAQDPYLTSGWSMHPWGDAIGDYMKTSQSDYGNNDGGTTFYSWTSSPDRLTCQDMVNNNIDDVDGTYGRKLFYEARGYTVTDCYSQKTDNNAGGFTFALFKAEIDAGRPVLLNLAGHSVVGVGYNDAASTVYIHDTWDFNEHSMTWGGSYSGMNLLSVSIVNLAQAAPPPLPGAFNKSSPANGATGLPTNPSLNWGSSSNATSYEYCVNTSASCPGSWTSVGSGTSAGLSGLSSGVQYYWQVRARNAQGTTEANNGTWGSFTTALPPPLPGAFNKSSPANGTTGLPTNPTLSWGSSSNATSYEYCVNTSASCPGSWSSAGSSTSAGVSGLNGGVTYYWQVRARNAQGTTEANNGAWASFTTRVYPPTITGFSPLNGPVGSSVQLTGTNFTGATAVRFNGENASFTVVSPTSIKTTVPPVAISGKISVVTPAGTASSASDFLVSSYALISIQTHAAAEGDGVMEIEVMLGASSSQPVTVRYATSDGTATAPADYLPSSGKLTFAPGISVMRIPVTIIDDTLREGDETFMLTLSEPENTSLPDPAQITCTIIDDDAQGGKIYVPVILK